MSNSVTKRFFLNSITFLAPALFVLGCSSPGSKTADRAAAPVLQVRWQRLVDDKGQTCGPLALTKTDPPVLTKSGPSGERPDRISFPRREVFSSEQEFSEEAEFGDGVI